MDSEKHQNNLYTFPTPEQNPHLTRDVVRGTSATIHAITESSELTIYYERDIHPASSAREFFETLIQTGHVTLYYEHEDMSHFTRLETGEESETYELRTEDFITLTATDPHHVGDTDATIEYWLRRAGIRIGMKLDEAGWDERHLSREDIETYHPEKIRAYDDGYYYHAELYDADGLSLGDSTGYKIDSLESDSTSEPTLLDVIFVALSESSLEQLHEPHSNMIITYFEHESASTLLTHITPTLLEQMIRASLIRLNPLYQNISLEKAMEHYMKQYKK